MTIHKTVKYNDGEGLTSGDLNRSQTYLSEFALEAVSRLSGHELGGVHDMAYDSASQGGDPFRHTGVTRSNLDAAHLYTPFPMNGIVIGDDHKAPTTIEVGAGVLVQKQTGNTPGTAPVGLSSDHPLVLTTEAAEYDIDGQWNAAPGAGDPRWDTVGVQLKFVQGGSESRDFKDATTGVLSTTTPDKEEQIGVNFEIQESAQGTAFDMGTMSTGYSPLLTKRRVVGESTPWDPTDFYYHVYPMRYAREVVYPGVVGYTTHAMENTTDAYMPRHDVYSTGIEDKGSPVNGTYLALPRMMHDGCRLVGIGLTYFNTERANDIRIARLTQGEFGLPTLTDVVDLVAINSRWGGSQSSGHMVISESDWSQSTTKRLPIWGNGYHYGPLFNPMREDYSLDVVPGYVHGDFDSLCVRVEMTASANEIGPIVFHYLY